MSGERCGKQCLSQSFHLLYCLLGRVWLLMNAALASLAQDTHAIERICRCIRSGLKASGELCAPMLPSLAAALPGHFSHSQHSAFLYVASELAKIFGRDASKADILKALMMELLTNACSKLRALEDFNQNPCIADDTFLLAKRMLQYCPQVLFSMAQVVELLLDTACAGKAPDSLLTTMWDGRELPAEF